MERGREAGELERDEYREGTGGRRIGSGLKAVDRVSELWSATGEQ